MPQKGQRDAAKSCGGGQRQRPSGTVRSVAVCSERRRIWVPPARALFFWRKGGGRWERDKRRGINAGLYAEHRSRPWQSSFGSGVVRTCWGDFRTYQSFIPAHRPAPLVAADRAGIGRLCLSCASRPYFRSLTRTRLCYLRTWSVGVSFGDKVGAPPTFSRAVTSRPYCPLLG